MPACSAFHTGLHLSGRRSESFTRSMKCLTHRPNEVRKTVAWVTYIWQMHFTSFHNVFFSRTPTSSAAIHNSRTNFIKINCTNNCPKSYRYASSSQPVKHASPHRPHVTYEHRLRIAWLISVNQQKSWPDVSQGHNCSFHAVSGLRPRTSATDGNGSCSNGSDWGGWWIAKRAPDKSLSLTAESKLGPQGMHRPSLKCVKSTLGPPWIATLF